jgi:hypothetical protein
LQKYLYTEKFKIGKLWMELVLTRGLLRCQIGAGSAVPDINLAAKRDRGNLRRAKSAGFHIFRHFSAF